MFVNIVSLIFVDLVASHEAPLEYLSHASGHTPSRMMRTTVTLLVGVLALIRCIEASNPINMRVIKYNKYCNFSDLPAGPVLLSFHNPKTQTPTPDFVAELEFVANDKYSVYLLQQQPSTTVTPPAANARTFIGTQLKQQIAIYEADLIAHDACTYTFTRVNNTPEPFTLERKHGKFYYFIYFFDQQPTPPLASQFVVTLDAQYAKKHLHEEHPRDKKNPAVKDWHLNLDRIEEISEQFYDLVFKIPNDAVVVSVLAHEEGLIFQNNTYSYIIIGVLIAGDVVFIVYYIVIFRKKKRMNDLIAQEKEPLESTKVPVESTTNESVTNLTQ